MKRNILGFAICVASVSFISTGMSAQNTSLNQVKGNSSNQQKEIKRPLYLDESKSFEARTWDLVHQMTLDEKALQMGNHAPAITRLGVPAYDWWNECLHGLARAGKATIFPQAIGLAATFDAPLIKQMASAIGDESRSFNNAARKRGNIGLYTGLTFYSPNVNIFRDPRWGRGQETYGEDPYLTSRIGVAFVEGLQGDSNAKYMRAAACAKHYAVHSGPEALRHRFDAVVDMRDLYSTYLPAFKALVTEAHVKSVMGAYNRVNGKAACASPTLLLDILRGQWHFDGYLTSDCGAISDIYRHHKLVKTAEEAVAMAINSTMNLNCGDLYANYLAKAVRKGMISEAKVDTLLFQLMLTRFQLGLFDDPANQPYMQISTDVVDSPEHKMIAYKTALESLVLLQNNDHALPIKSDVNQIYVVGPTANTDDALIGNYYGVSGQTTNILEGIVNAAPAGVSVIYKSGTELAHPAANPIDWVTGEAMSADATIACIGLTSLLEGEEGDAIASTQKGDMMENALPANQLDFLRKLSKKKRPGHPLIAVVTGGTPIELQEVSELADAILFVWYPGEAGGKAIADVLFGQQSPSGKSPITFVKDVNKLPPFIDYNMKGRTYRYMTDTDNIQYPFGYGLSYAQFAYSDLQLPAHTIKVGQGVPISVKVTNKSDIASDEVVQFYLSDREASVPVPIRQLVGFQRIHLDAGESQIVRMMIQPEQFSIITDDGKRVIEKGVFEISAGNGQPIAMTKSFVKDSVKVKRNKELPL